MGNVGWMSFVRSPWMVPRLLKIPWVLRALTDPKTFLDVHREVQGARLLSPDRGSDSTPEPRRQIA